MSRRNTTKRPPPRTHAPLLAVIELSFGASKPATHRRLKTGHQVGGTGWKNRLLRTYVQGVSVQFVPSVPVFRSAAASPPRNRRAFPVGALAGFGPASAPPSAGRLWSR